MGRDEGKRLLMVPLVGLLLAAGLWFGSGAATAVGSKAPAHRATAFWTRCSLRIAVSEFEISPVEVLHMTCASAGRVIERGHVLDSPGGPDLLDARIRVQLKGDPAAGGPVPGQPAGGRVLQARKPPAQLRLGIRELRLAPPRTRLRCPPDVESA